MRRRLAIFWAAAAIGCDSRTFDLGNRELDANAGSVTTEAGVAEAGLARETGTTAENDAMHDAPGATADNDAMPDAPDTTPPFIVDISTDGDNAVAVQPAMRVTFSEPIGSATADAQTFQLVGPDGNTVSATVTVDGAVVTVVPAGTLMLAGAYTLTVGTGVRDLAGNALVQSRQSRFRTRDGAWGEPVNLGTTGGGPKLAFDGLGRAFVVWFESGTSFCNTGAARYDTSGGWTILPSTYQGAGTGCGLSEVASDRQGRLLITWTGADSQAFCRARVYDLASGWGDMTAQFGGTSPAVAMTDGHGWAITTSLYGCGTPCLFSGVHAAEYTDGAGWIPFRQIPTPSDAGTMGADDGAITASRGLVGVAADAAGHANVVWYPQNQASSIVYALRYDGSAWSVPAPIASFGSEVVIKSLSLSGNRDGHAFATWEEAGPSPAIGVSSYSPAGAWTAARRPWPAGGFPGPASNPHIAAGKSDDAVAIWTQTDSGAGDAATPPLRVWGASLAGGASDWSAPAAISPASVNPPSSGTAPPVALAADTLGHALSVWVEAGSSGNAVGSGRFLSGTGWGASALISGSAPVGGAIRIAVDDWGRAIAVWSAPGGGIWAARFE